MHGSKNSPDDRTCCLSRQHVFLFIQFTILREDEDMIRMIGFRSHQIVSRATTYSHQLALAICQSILFIKSISNTSKSGSNLRINELIVVFPVPLAPVTTNKGNFFIEFTPLINMVLQLFQITLLRSRTRKA